MRLALLLSIITFTSTLWWERLLYSNELLWAFIIFLTLLLIPRLRAMAVIPFIIVYFSLYSSLTLTGKMPFNTLIFQNDNSVAHYVDKKDHQMIVKVNSLINKKNKGYFQGKLMAIDGDPLYYSPRVELRWYRANVILQDGQLIKIKGRVKPIYGRGNPGGFDRQKWLYSEHIAYQVRIKQLVEVIDDDISFRAKLYLKVKHTIRNFDNQGILLALTFADKSLISFEKKQTIQQLGISHLFAISGLHIGLFFGFIYFLVNLVVVRSLPGRYLGWFSWRLVNAIALVGALFYAYLAGFSLPTQRAFLMLFVAVMLLSMRRKSAVIDLLGLILFIVLLWDPLAVMGLSLWLSFFAVSIIIFILWAFSFRPSPTQTANTWSTVLDYVKALVFIQLGLSFLMLPIQILSFSGINVLAPLINLVAIPLFSLLVIPCVLLGASFSIILSGSALSGIATFLFTIADYLVSGFFSMAREFQWFYENVSQRQSELIIFVVCVLICLMIANAFFAHKRKFSLIYFSVVLVFFGLFYADKAKISSDKWQIEGIDVGQGLSVLIRSQGKTLLYDTGPRYPSGFTTAKVEIVPYLEKLGIKQLDYLVISHSDSDHAGGFAEINQRYHPKNIVLGEPLKKMPLNRFDASLCRAGDNWQLGGLNVRVLSPLKRGKNNNNNSCVLQIFDSHFSVLLTGDIDKKQEKKLVERYGDRLKSDLLFAPHHGSKHSSSTIFIKKVAPKYVVFSAGFMNHWGFPAQETQDRYRNQSVTMINSGISGFIRVIITKHDIKIQTYREYLAPYWYHSLQ